MHGGPLAFALVREAGVLRRARPGDAGPLTIRPPPFAGLAPHPDGRPLVVGIVNVTPDSFSGDGHGTDHGAAVAHGLALRNAGADILDVGGESTRPGAEPVSPVLEQRRVLPVVRALAATAPISIDTRHASTMAAALDAGAVIVNDVTALRHDPDAPAVARHARGVVLMHMPGTDPLTMQARAHYGDVVRDVAAQLAERVAALRLPNSVAVDPGIGFGKTTEHNLELLDRLPALAGLGCPILVGASRKRFIGTLAGVEGPAAARMPGSVAVALAAAARGAALLRVHDVAETVQALKLWAAIGFRTGRAS